MFQNTQDLYEFFDAFQNVTYKKKNCILYTFNKMNLMNLVHKCSQQNAFYN